MTLFKAIANGTTPTLRAFFIVLVIIISAFAIAWMLSGCRSTYQPPGGGVWKAL